MQTKFSQTKLVGAAAAVAVVLALTVGGVVAVKAAGNGAPPSGSRPSTRTLQTSFGE